MKIPYPNAFVIHGSFETYYPLSLSAHPRLGDTTFLEIMPIRIRDVSDLVEQYAQDVCVVFDVEQYTLSDPLDPRRFLSLEQIARLRGVGCHTYASDLITIPRNEFGKLTGDFQHTHFHVFDLPSEPEEHDLLEHLIAYEQYRDDRSWSLLDRIEGSHIFLDSYEDLFLLGECLDQTAVKALVTRSLQLFVGTVVFEQIRERPDIAQVPDSLLEEIVGLDPAFTAPYEGAVVDGERVRFGFSNEGFSYTRERPYQTIGQLEYDLQAGSWAISWAR